MDIIFSLAELLVEISEKLDHNTKPSRKIVMVSDQL